MNKKIGIAILAHGETHILESLNLLKSMREKTNHEFDYYVATNDVSKFQDLNVNVIEIQGDFNYNLKVVPIEESLKYNDTTIFIDSDTVMLEDVNYNDILNIEDGLHSNRYQNYPKRYPYYSVLQDESGIEDIYYFFEHFFIIKITSEDKKKTFIDNWKRLSEKTKPFHVYSKGQIGANVGLIIGAACQISDIKIIQYTDSGAHSSFLAFHHLYI